MKAKSVKYLPVTAGDINMFHARAIADQQITYLIYLSDSLDTEKLERSLTLLLKKIPILRSTLGVNKSHIYRIPEDGAKLSVPIVYDPDHPNETITEFVSTPCDPEKELPLKLMIIRSKGEDTLCIKIDHVVSDAGGLKYLLYLLSEAYTKGDITSSINSNRGLWQIFRKFSPVKLIWKASQAKITRPGTALFNRTLQDNKRFLERTTLESDLFKRLHSKAKKFNMTINDVVLTAVYRTIFQYPTINNAAAYPVMVPIDMRRYLPYNKRRTIANLSSSLYPAIGKIKNEGFTDTLCRVKKHMDTLKKDSPGLDTIEMMALAASFGGKIIKKNYERAATHGARFINLTNFGVIDETQLIFDNIPVNHVFGIGPVQCAPGILIALSTFRDTLNFAVQGNDTIFVKAFLASVITELKGYIES
jgi:NRPS condensation-like uncharacterized protein